MGLRTVPGGVLSRRPACRSHIGCPRWSCGSHLACAGRASLDGRERLERGLPSSKQRCPPRSISRGGASDGGRMSKALAGQDADRVVVGMDPHKRSVTIEVMAGDETVLGGGRFATTVEGYRAMRAHVAAWPERVWAIEGCAGIGGHVASRLLGRRRAGRGRAAEAVGAGAGVHHRAGPQDRRHRRALRRPGRHPDDRPASGRRRRPAGRAAGPGRPAPVTGRGPHPDGLPSCITCCCS